jgi:hypothetical protein
MPYAFLNPDGTIKTVVLKLSPYMKVLPGERIVNFNPPVHDPELEIINPVLPVPDDSMDMQFVITPKDAATYEDVQIRRKTALVQYHLDTAAQQRGYDNIMSAVSYANSTHPVYGPEGKAFMAWRDACWEVTFIMLESVFAGAQQMPSDTEIIQQLPVLTL